MYIWMPFNSFQMGVLKVLNTVPSQLHPSNWGYIQAFVIVFQVIRITPTLAIFLYYFRTRLNAKKRLVSLISKSKNSLFELLSLSFKGFKDIFFKVEITDLWRPHFFTEDSQPRFPLYWTQNLIKVFSWSQSDMTLRELESLDLLDSLSRQASPRTSIL